MKITGVSISKEIEKKLNTKHNVQEWEVKEVFFNTEASLLVRKSQSKYAAYGCTYAGRYLLVGFKILKDGIVEVRTARDMTAGERKLYRR